MSRTNRGPRELNWEKRTDRFYRGGFSRLRGPRDMKRYERMTWNHYYPREFNMEVEEA